MTYNPQPKGVMQQHFLKLLNFWLSAFQHTVAEVSQPAQGIQSERIMTPSLDHILKIIRSWKDSLINAFTLIAFKNAFFLNSFLLHS